MDIKAAAPFLAEFVGTAYLCFAVVLTFAQSLPYPVPPIAIGGTLLVMVASMGHVSGAHFNPAVTLGILISGRKQLTLLTAVGYIVVQLLAAVGVGFAVRPLAIHPLGEVGKDAFWEAFAVEAVWTAALTTTVLNSATNKKTSGNSFYPISIGTAVAAGALLLAPISGGVFNPAVTLALLCFNAKISSIAAVSSAPWVGGIAAGLIYIVVHRDEYREASEEAEPLLQPQDTPY